MTIQEAYLKIKNHLLTQNQKSISENGSYAYRGINGTKCAIGILMSDEDYKPMYEDMSIGGLRRYDIPSLNIIKEDPKLFQALQELHDTYNVSEWKSLLKDIEEEFDLKSE